MIRRIAICTLLGAAAVLALSWSLYERRGRGEPCRAEARTCSLVTHLAETLGSDVERTASDLRLLANLGSIERALLKPRAERL